MLVRCDPAPERDLRLEITQASLTTIFGIQVGTDFGVACPVLVGGKNEPASGGGATPYMASAGLRDPRARSFSSRAKEVGERNYVCETFLPWKEN